MNTTDRLEQLLHQLSELDGVRTVLDRVKEGKTIRLGSVPGGAASALTAVLQDATERPVLLLTPDENSGSDRARELQSMFDREVYRVPPASSDVRDRTSGQHTPSSRISALLDWVNRSGDRPIMICSLLSLMQSIPPPSEIDARTERLTIGDTRERDTFVEELVDLGYRRTDRVLMAGEFAVRGGVLDLFPEDTDEPYRLEFFGDEIESIRPFDPGTQTSSQPCEQVDVTLVNRKVLSEHASIDTGTSLIDLFDREPQAIWYEPDRIAEKGDRIKRYHDDERAHERFVELSMHPAFEQRVTLSAMPVPEDPDGTNLKCGSVSPLGNTEEHLKQKLTTLAGEVESILIACPTEGEQQRMRSFLSDRDLPDKAAMHVVSGDLSGGFLWPEQNVAVASRKHTERGTETGSEGDTTPSAGTRPIDDFLELEVGDYVVHDRHGIARYGGMTTTEKGGEPHDVMKLFFKDSVLLEVPETEVHRVQKYLGSGKGDPSLSKLGGDRWEQKKQSVSEDVRELGKELIEVQAMREQGIGHACQPDTRWQAEFEAAFPHRETPDQERINAKIKKKMESSAPMDLLLTGDVGFGKTELAMRATFKMVMEGKQVAMMAPTTVLTHQHVRTFRERMGPYPIRVNALSRFQSGSEQREIIEDMEEGSVDVVIGTHRLLSEDVSFDDLGLVIIDEEQRFGVEHKQKLKQLRATVDVLTMTATPIPRSLHMALLGIRDIATLRTPPEGRRNIRTNVMAYDEDQIQEALVRELERDGQVYYLHNRVQTIKNARDRVQELVPDARVRVAHGQMSGQTLERVMNRFYDREIDVLVCTTIIESGLDQKNVNTMIVEDADRFGLADLHQLRGRIGRHHRRGFAYFLLPRDRPLTPVARRRLEAIEEHDELGSGFKLAMRDLEIRGAGRILGKKQSGHIDTVGYDMFCKLLEREIKKLKDEEPPPDVHPSVQLSLDVRIPDTFAGTKKDRMRLYRRFGQCDTEEELDRLLEEMTDQYGDQIPEPVQNLAELNRLRLRAAPYTISSIKEGDDLYILRFQEKPAVRPLLNHHPDRVRKTGDQKLYLYREDDPETDAEKLEDLLSLFSSVTETAEARVESA